MLHSQPESVRRSERITRRTFLGAAPLIVPASALGRGATAPSDRIALGIIGTGGRAVYEGKYYAGSDSCQIVALCDVQKTRREAAKAVFEGIYAKRNPSSPNRGMRLYNDFRELLRQNDIDAVYNVAPDHWHVPMGIAAAKAGKHIHYEKPFGVSIAQEIAAAKAIRKAGVVFQYGTERRSTEDARHAVELLVNGRIGKVKQVWVIAPPSATGGRCNPEPVPEGFDYDLWLGPAPQKPFCHDRCLNTGNENGIFHIYDYCLGFIQNWGIHPLDIVQWWADNTGRTVPVSYEGAGTIASGGLFDTVTNWDMHCRYEDGLLLRFLDDETAKKYPEIPGVRDMSNAATFVGTDGWISISYRKVTSHPESLIKSEIGPNEKRLVKSDSHQLSWIEAIRTKAPTVSPLESAARSGIACHLSDICIRTGRPVKWDEKNQTIIGEADQKKMIARAMRKPWSVA
jgi:hypothetical protein